MWTETFIFQSSIGCLHVEEYFRREASVQIQVVHSPKLSLEAVTKETNVTNRDHCFIRIQFRLVVYLDFWMGTILTMF